MATKLGKVGTCHEELPLKKLHDPSKYGKVVTLCKKL